MAAHGTTTPTRPRSGVDPHPVLVEATLQLEQATALDRLVGLLQPVAAALVATRGPADLLHGRFMGHAAHPLLTQVPDRHVGELGRSSTSSAARRSRPAATRLIGTGILAAVPTAVTGLAEWAVTTDQPARRVGVVHAVANTVGLLLYTASYRSRRRGHHLRGVGLGMTALSVVGRQRLPRRAPVAGAQGRRRATPRSRRRCRSPRRSADPMSALGSGTVGSARSGPGPLRRRPAPRRRRRVLHHGLSGRAPPPGATRRRYPSGYRRRPAPSGGRAVLLRHPLLVQDVPHRAGDRLHRVRHVCGAAEGSGRGARAASSASRIVGTSRGSLSSRKCPGVVTCTLVAPSRSLPPGMCGSNGPDTDVIRR